ncbi:ribonuclease T2 [Candidatus Parabeggiatoa sp. HSG14]|uniref:ribonuclease T2 n=1 Tax=Candidatus Parabeggiatoa sp. HSG14 TaxID=3055593 RepID=UPI0025A886EB|nr:ribonuclease T2 [Thiotrichales bacterium HSG14]
MNKLFRLTTVILFLGYLCLSLPLQAKTKVSKEVGKFDYYTLALSWQSAFCESNPKKQECQSQHEKRFDAYHFVLHGLWPNVKGDKRHHYGYCGVSKKLKKKDKKGRWCDMPQLDLSKEVREHLTQFMPATVSCLQRHEWYKHGICSGLSEDDYFSLSNQLVETFSKTRFSAYVAKNAGKYVKRKKLLKAFAREFGKRSRAYLKLQCRKIKGVSLLTEVQINLKKNLKDVSDFSRLFTEEKLKIHGTCPRSFKIDEVGINGN